VGKARRAGSLTLASYTRIVVTSYCLDVSACFLSEVSRGWFVFDANAMNNAS